ncbi:hypothetical protein J6590_051030 [Homalodisca vitripennis]|nr:hypothetical protein J6590_051030 [Homalodisca vitripennis]
MSKGGGDQWTVIKERVTSLSTIKGGGKRTTALWPQKAEEESKGTLGIYELEKGVGSRRIHTSNMSDHSPDELSLGDLFNRMEGWWALSENENQAPPVKVGNLIQYCKMTGKPYIIGCDANAHHLVSGSMNINRPVLYNNRETIHHRV